MGYHGTEHLNRIYRESARYEFFPSSSLTSNVYSRDVLENKSGYRAQQFHPAQKFEMYSMPSIFNFHLKVDENQQHQFLQPSNGVFLKKEIPINPPPGQLMPPPPMAHSSQAVGIAAQGSANVPVKINDDNFILEQHIKVDKNNPKPYSCNYCSKVYKQLMGIKNHVKAHLQVNPDGTLNCSVCGKASTKRTITKPFVCPTCKDARNQIQQQQNHNNQQQLAHQQQQQLLHHGHGSSVNYVQPASQSSRKSNQNACSEEEDDFPESEKQYQCQYCSKRFQHPSTLKMHQKKHNDDKPFLCEVCLKNFKRNSSLKIHSRTHTGEKTHECNYCGKLFAYEVFLKVHIRKHTGEKPYACNLCDKTFTQAGNLKSHMKRKHLVGV